MAADYVHSEINEQIESIGEILDTLSVVKGRKG